mgnify:CR=1 FL=1
MDALLLPPVQYSAAACSPLATLPYSSGMPSSASRTSDSSRSLTSGLRKSYVAYRCGFVSMCSSRGGNGGGGSGFAYRTRTSRSVLAPFLDCIGDWV